MDRPLPRAWQTLLRYPVLALVPVVWELLSAGLLWLLGLRSPAPSSQFAVKFLLPSVLPSGGELLGAARVTFGIGAPFLLLAVAVVQLLLSSLVGAGFLHLLRGALRDQPPTWGRFTEGITRFGPRLLTWNLIIGGVVMIVALMGAAVGPAMALLMIIGFLLTLFLVLVPYLIVVDDCTVGEAVSHASGRFMENLGDLLVIALTSVALSAAVSFLLSALSIRWLVVASPLWGFMGTAMTLAVVAVVVPPWDTPQAQELA